MMGNKNEGKCAFGVFLDIVDSLREMNEKKISQAVTKRCSSCSKELESTAKTCSNCGKPQPE